MKSIKHLFILMLAVCFSSLVKAQCTAAFTDTVIGNNITVNATAQSVTGYAWYIDGTLSVAANPNTSFTFQNVLPGTHSICLWLYVNNTFLCDTVCKNVTVTSCGSLTAYWNFTTPVNDTVRFAAYDTISLAHHVWSFGDGTNASGTTATHVYSAPGTYTACFYSYIPGTSCIDSLCRTVTIPPASNACGVASFTSYILNDSTIRCYSTSAGAGDSSSYVWNVYNANGLLVQSSSTGHNSSFLSQSIPTGTYKVCLDLYSGLNVLCDSFCSSVSVLRCSSLTASYTYTASANSDTLVVIASTNNPAGTTYTWHFGDGASSTATSVTHVYAQSGNYVVTLLVGNPALTCVDTMYETITIGNPNACGIASFAYYVLNDSTIRGYSNSTGTSDSSSYVWNIYGTSGNLIQSYSTGHINNFLSGGLPIGTYKVCLDLYNAQHVLCDSACNSIQVLRCSSLIGAWQYASSATSDTVRFYGSTSNPTGTTFAWTFGDGNTSSLGTPMHVYAQAGVYNVCLVVSNPALSCRDTFCQSVTVGNPNACGTASFYYYVLNDSTIRGYSSSTGTSDSSSYVWNIYGTNGNLIQSYSTGHTSSFLSGALPVGTYRVCLDLYNAAHSFCDSACNSISILSCSNLTAAWTYTASSANDTLKVAGSTTNPSGTTYSWTFGDGATSSYAGFTHVYAQSGVYTVCLVVGNPALTCRDTLCQSITIGSPNACGTASFEYYVLNDSTIRGYSNSTGTSDSSSYVWNIYGTSGNLIQTYSTGHTNNFLSGGLPIGTYRVCLDLYNAAHTFCDSACNTIQVLRCSSLNAQYFSTVLTNDSVKFSPPTNNPSGSTFTWTFGDGTSSTSTTVTHVYSQAGTYTACLIVSNPALTCHDTLCKSITATGTNCGTLTAYWNFPTPVNDTVRFTAYDTVSAAHHIWSFGDGTNGSGTSVTHVYAAGGTYNVCFYSYIPGTTCTDSFCRTVVVPSNMACGTASFSDYVYGDSSIHAFSNSTGTNSSTIYAWTIKGANGNIIQTQTGSSYYIISQHLYPGVYTVCLTLYQGTALCDSTCSTVVVPLIGACGTASFGDTVYAGVGGGAIHAYTTSTNVDSLSQYSWKIWGPNGGLVQTFTGGDFTSSTLDTGTYTVCQYIRATGSTYICDSICSTVVVGGGSNPCNGLTASWTHNLQSNTTDSVEFHAATNPAGAGYYWRFGDGTSGYGQNITHGYAQSGTYTACLYVILSGTNCSDSSCQTITITTTTPCPVAAFGLYVYNDSTIHAFSSSTGTTANTVYAWHVTNSAGVVVQTETSVGTTASLLSHALPNGTYDVCLFIYANTGTYCDSVCHTITIADSVNPCGGLNATFTAAHLSNGNVQFTEVDSAAGLTHYWHFGDGTIATGPNPVHAYATAGLYHVCQYVFYAGAQCLDSFCINVQAGASGCSANFSAQGYYPPYNGVHFTNLSTSSDSIISYRWTFGDSTYASFASGDHVFPHSGTWYVCLTIYASNGCSSTYCDSVKVSYDPCYGLSSTYTYTYTSGGGVHFAGSTSITNATNYWAFGDGTSATTFDPTHYYTQGGTYTVCHIVSIPGTLCSDTTCQSVQGSGTNTGCQASFTDTTSNTLNQIIFYNNSTSSDSVVSSVWSFGDGTSSTYHNTYHTYSTHGTYYVCLTITSLNGCTSTHCDSVHVGTTTPPACHASFTYTVDSCQVITFTSTSTGSLDFLRWIYGDGTTDTTYHPTHHYAQGGVYTVILHFYGNGCYNFDTAQITVPACGSSNDTVCGYVFDDLNGNGVQNTGEPGVASAEVHIGSYVTFTDSTGHYEVIVPAGTYTIYYCAPAGYAFSIPVYSQHSNSVTCAAYQAVQIGSGTNCGYNFGIIDSSASICGTVYFDANDNHAQDPGESGIPGAQVTFSSGGQVVYTCYTDQYGHYCAVLKDGNYVITATSTTYAGGVVYPGSITVAATGGGAFDNNNFGIYVTPAGCDLSIKITPNTTITPGYPAWYQIQVCNVGTNVTSGTVNLFYDPTLRFNYGSPVPSTQNSTTFTASWDLTNLNPGSCQYYYVSLTTDSTDVAGQFIFTLANVTTNGCSDINLANNVDTLHQNVTASWDPNNKQVSPEGNISDNQWLTYTINFQNTGTAPAINIVIEDTLSANLDVSTFKMLGASLPYTLQFAGNVAIWKFNSVSLPDSSTDQQGSHGFVSFMILPVQGLPGKSHITNQADIYFDFNAGVSTNQTLNTIDYPLSVAQIAADNVTITLQPNPFSQYTTIKIDGAEGPYDLNVYDMLGRLVKAQPASGNIFNVERGSLASGMYTYEILEQGKVIGKGKMIAQ